MTISRDTIFQSRKFLQKFLNRGVFLQKSKNVKNFIFLNVVWNERERCRLINNLTSTAILWILLGIESFKINVKTFRGNDMEHHHDQTRKFEKNFFSFFRNDFSFERGGGPCLINHSTCKVGWCIPLEF